VRLIAPDGQQVGIVSIEEAMRQAREAGLDLVEVGPEAKPPACRILDFGKFKYRSRRKAPSTAPTKKQHFGQIKEIRLRPKIDKHDLERKVNHAREILELGYRLQITCVFRGREMTHLELGHKLLENVVGMLSDVAKLERPLNREGRRMNVMVMPRTEVVRAKTKEREENAKRRAMELEEARKKKKAKRESRRAKAAAGPQAAQGEPAPSGEGQAGEGAAPAEVDDA